MKRTISLFLFSILIFACKKDVHIELENLKEPSGRRLRVIVDEKFSDKSMIIGVSCGLWANDYGLGQVINREFGYVTPENEFKQKIIHPNNIDWNFETAYEWIEYAKKNGQILRMHCPIGPQVSEWAESDDRTPDELEQNMTDFLTMICCTFDTIENVKYMDVVNETVVKGEWFGPKKGAGGDLWENPWTQIGVDDDKNHTPLYLKKAFEICNKNAPHIKQLYNHHEGPENIESWQLIKETILYLKQQGLKIDAVGWQAHVENGWATSEHLNALENLIDWTQKNDMEFHITEASSFIVNKYCESELELQAITYSKILNVLLEKSRLGKVGWNTWHLTDAYTYRSEYYPSLFDENCNAKPAYYAIQNCLEEF